MRHILLGLAIGAVPLAALPAQTMPVSTFLAKAEALRSKGALALLSSDIGVLKGEVQKSGAEIRAEAEAARKAGRQPTACPPEKAAVTANELLAHMRAIPPAQRGMTVKAAFHDLVRKKYPCRG